jgi:hypothetical protein
MSLMDFPAFYRSHISFLRASDNPPGRPNFVTPASRSGQHQKLATCRVAPTG